MKSVTPVARNLPQFDLGQVRALVEEYYGLDGNYTSLVSERDLTWIVTRPEGERAVVKIANAAEPEGVIDLQVKCLAHILEQAPDLPVPQVIPTRSGKPYEWVRSDRSGERHMLRVVSYLEGRVVSSVSEGYSYDYYHNIGATLGHLSLALQSFFHPYAGDNVHLWDISRCLQLREMIPGMADDEARALATDIIDEAEHSTLVRLKKTRCQVVHQDAHEDNVLVAPDDVTRVVGILDFGDMGYNSILTEIVTAAEAVGPDETDPIRPLIQVAKGFDSVNPLTEIEVDLLFDVLRLRLAVYNIIAQYRKVHDREDSEHLSGTDKYLRMLKSLVIMGRETVTRRLREALRFPVYSPLDSEGPAFANRQPELLERREKHLGRIWHFYDTPLHITRARGAWMYGADGTAYLDAYNNVPQVGHSHPHVVNAISRQARALNTNTRYLCDIVADYAARLTRDLPDHLDTCIFVNSGSEANDLAVQIAQSLSGNRGGLVLDNAYHGCTELSTAYSPESWLHLPPEQHPAQIERLLEPDTYRGPHAGDPDAAANYAADADRAIADLAGRGFRPAAFLVDTALCAHGLITPPEGYFNRVAGKTRAAGGYVIADEVQAGLGRMGSFWGFQAAGLDADNVDFITMGKPVANGHPLGVIILSSRMMEQFINGTHPMLFSTFGGNTVACAAGMAVLDVIEQEGLLEKANRVGDYLRGELWRLAGSHPLIGDVRGRGMLVGVELVEDRVTKAPAIERTGALIEEMLRHRVMIGKATPGRLKLRPSLAWGEAEVDFFIEALDQSLRAID